MIEWFVYYWIGAVVSAPYIYLLWLRDSGTARLWYEPVVTSVIWPIVWLVGVYQLLTRTFMWIDYHANRKDTDRGE